MRRTARHTHAVRTIGDHTTLEECVEKRWLWGQTWCGETNGSRLPTELQGEDPFAYARRMADCPGCSAAIGKARLAQLAGRVTLEKVEVPKGRYGSYYRTAWAISIDGELIAHAVMQNGWGNPWELKDLRMEVDEEHQFGSTVSHMPSRSYPAKPEDVCQPVHFSSKEMMAALAFRCREKGELLFTREERRAFGAKERERRAAEEAERAANKIKYEAERQRKEGLRAERKQLALDGIQIALGRALTNSEIAGLQAALDIINGKDVQ